MAQVISYLPVLLAILAVMLPFLKERARAIAANVLLIAGALFLVFVIYQLFNKQGTISRAHAVAVAERMESVLRVQSSYLTSVETMMEMFTVSPVIGKGEAGKQEMSEKARLLIKQKENLLKQKNTAQNEPAFNDVIDAYRDAVSQDATNSQWKVKLVILLFERMNLSEFRGSERREADRLLNQLADSASQTDKNAAAGLRLIQTKRNLSPDQVIFCRKAMEEATAPGWFRDTILYRLYEQNPGAQGASAYLQEYKAKCWSVFVKIVFLFLLGIFFGLLGLGVIIFELATLSRQKPGLTAWAEQIGLNIDLRTVALVFVSWFVTQVALGKLMHVFLPSSPERTPFMVAASFCSMYLVSSLPALWFVYKLILQPNGLTFRQDMKLCAKTSHAGPVKLVMQGFLAWCSLLPLVIGMNFIATRYLGSTGSDNPVLKEIFQAASSHNLFAIAFFYISVAVLAPFFEELLFRGVLYQALRLRFNTFVSMLASAFAFSAIHFDQGGFLMLLVVGLVLAYIFERTKSLLPGMVAHGLWNGGMFTVALCTLGS